VAAAIWFGCAAILGAPLDGAWLKPAAFVIAAVILLQFAFDRWLWELLPTSLTKKPVLRGTWKGYIKFEYPEGTDPQTKTCYLAIRQTFTEISVHMYLDISKSASTGASISHQDGQEKLSWTYWSKADAFNRKDNPPHQGAAEVAITMKPSERLDGDYWTWRKTRGRIVVDQHSKTFYTSFQSAEDAFK